MLIIIHLSDLHIRHNQKIDNDFVNSLVNAINSEISFDDYICFVCSGDIAYSGRGDEYTIATDFFTRLLQNYKNYKLIIAPGNHDNNFNADTSVRESVLKDILNSQQVTEAQIKECLKTQENFDKFINQINANGNNIDKLLRKEIFFDYTDKSISFSIINSAYCTNKESKEGQIFIPIEYLLCSSTGADYKIAILHHTPNWFMSSFQREVRSALNTYDLLLLGHEHQPSTYVIENNKQRRTNFVEGGIIGFDNSTSTFNLIKLDLINDNIKIIEFKYDNKCKIFRNNKEDEYTINETKYNTDYINLTQEFRNFLDDPGAIYRNPYKENLRLSDIYIPPDICNIQRDKNDEVKSSTSLISDELGKVIICGDDKYGKTSLSKYIFSELILSGYIPIYIDCKESTKNSLNNINKLIIRSYEEQYVETDIDKFKQNSHELVIPILDNFHLSNLNIKEKVNILRKLYLNYANSFTFINNILLIDEFKRVEDLDFNDNIISNFSYFKIKAFGHKLRGRLIKKWLSATDDNLDNDNTYLNQYDHYMNIFNKIVSNNLVPPLPIYFLTALSSFNNLDLSFASYGEYYRALTTLALANDDNRPSEIDIKINFLSELAFKLFNDKSTSLNNSNLIDFIDYYNTKFATNIDISFINGLIKTQILIESNGMLYFKYKFIFYYFIANYIYRNLYEDENIDIAIDRLINTIYLQSSSAILLIVISFIKDAKILNKISSYAKSIFSDSSPAYIGDDTKHFNSLIGNALNIVIEESVPSKSRQENEQLKDSLSNETTNFIGTDDDMLSDDNIDKFTVNLSSTIHFVNIIGQILKSHYGSLRTDQKETLFDEGINLPLRALGDFYNYMRINTSMWLDEIKECLEKKSANDSTTIEGISRNFLLALCSGISYFFLSLPVRSFATNNLKKTYDKYFSTIKKTNATELLEFYIELTTSKEINFKKLKHLVTLFKGNVMGFSILQYIISNHLYMYKVKSSDKSKIASLLNISINKQVMIEINSKEYK